MLSFKQFLNEIADKNYRDSYHGLKSRGRGNKSTYDPKHVSVEPEKLAHPDVEGGRTLGWHHKLRIKKHVVSFADDIIPKEDKVIHRGMSHDEYKNMIKSGKIKSRGTGNIGNEQKGATYFTSDPGSAGAYASSFAMSKHKPTPKKHAYVVSIKRPHKSKIIPSVEGTGEHEIGVSGHVSTDQITAVHRGRVIAHTPAEKSNLGSTAASNHLHWEKIK